MEKAIVSRHEAAVEFIKTAAPEFTSAPVLSHASREDVRGKVVAGNLPLHLAAEAAEVVAVEFMGTPPRGQEYGLAEMLSAGATLRRYVVLNAAQLETLSRILRAEGCALSAQEAIALAKRVAGD